MAGDGRELATVKASDTAWTASTATLRWRHSRQESLDRQANLQTASKLRTRRPALFFIHVLSSCTLNESRSFMLTAVQTERGLSECATSWALHIVHGLAGRNGVNKNFAVFVLFTKKGDNNFLLPFSTYNFLKLLTHELRLRFTVDSPPHFGRSALEVLLLDGALLIFCLNCALSLKARFKPL